MKKRVTGFILTIVLISVMMNQVIASPVFTDTGSHWAKEYIDMLTQNGAIKGYTDNTFKPENKISRAEFTAILLRALNKDVGQPEDGTWYDNYITEAANRKYILAGEFDNVEENITRGEMARMIVRTMAEEFPSNLTDYASQLADYSKTPAAYQDFVLKAYVKGIITGRPGGIFAHADPATRAEATTMIVRLIDTARRIVTKVPERDGVYIYEIDSKEEMEVKSSYPELITAVKEAMKVITVDDERSEIFYSKEDNSVHFFWYKGKEERNKSILERVPVLAYSIYTEQKYSNQEYIPYSLTLYDAKNTEGQEKFKTLVIKIFPEAYEKTVKELQNKLKDIAYKKRLSEHIKGREVRIFTASNKYQISVYTKLKDK